MGIAGSIRARGAVAGATALLAVVVVAAAAARGPVPQAQARGTLSAVQLGTFTRPMYPAQPPGGPNLLFVVQQQGRIAVIDHGTTLTHPFLDIRDRVLAPGEGGTNGERGLLSMAFAPDYQTSRRFYVYFTNNAGNVEIDEFRRSSSDPTRANPSSRRQVIVVPHPTYENHNGGTIQFGPGGLLYFATGDGGGVTQEKGRFARDLHSLLGKVIRIDPLPHGAKPYGIPQGNPYVGKPGRDEIFAYGLRNPFRFSFDGGRIAIADVGHHNWEEINFLTLSDARGANFGWPYWEGDHRSFVGQMGPDPATFPILEYPHNPACAVIGGFVVRNSDLPSLDHRYLYADRCVADLRSFIPRALTQQALDDSSTGITPTAITGFGEGLGGEVYFTAGSGVYQVTESP